MDGKRVSVEAILNGVDYLKTQFNNKMNQETEQVNQAYTSLSAGGLQSANIDAIIGDIKSRIIKLQQDFEMVEENIRKDLSQTAETVSASTKNIESNISQG